MNRLVAGAAALVASLLLAAGAVAPAHAATARGISLRQQKPPASALTTVVLRGTLTRSPKRSTVLIERRSGTTWRTVKTLHTDAHAGFVWTYLTSRSGTSTYRARSPRTQTLPEVVSPPVTVTAHTGWSQISQGSGHNCGVSIYGTLWCWGKNEHGQLGNDSTVDAAATAKVRVGAANNWTSVAAGGAHTCAIDLSGRLWCWGNDSNGQLGIGSTTTELVPQQVSPGTIWRGVVAGDVDTCAVRQDQSAWCWGADDYGQLGVGSDQPHTAPVRLGATWSSLSMDSGGHTVCGIHTDKTLWCWGEGGAGQLGIGALQGRSVPTQEYTKDSWSSVGAGDDSVCAVTTSGQTKCWGSNSFGKLGWLGGSYSSVPVAVTGGHVFTSASSGAANSCALDTSHHVWCWGYRNEFADPEPDDVGAGYRSVTASGSGICAIHSDDSAECWNEPYGPGI